MLSPDEKKHILLSYVPLMKFFAQQMPDTEIVLHDVSNLDHSIIAIENSHISGRDVGGASTDLVLRILKDQSFRDRFFTEPYTSATDTGTFLSSGTYFIKHEGELLGLLCTNTDITPSQNLIKAVSDLMESRRLTTKIQQNETQAISEKLTQSVGDIPVQTTLEIIRELELRADHLTQEEKLQVVQEIERRGVFLLKGSIASVAKVLRVSEPTLYRYIRQVRN